MLILILVAAVWALVMLACLALCIATKRTDAQISLDKAAECDRPASFVSPPRAHGAVATR